MNEYEEEENNSDHQQQYSNLKLRQQIKNRRFHMKKRLAKLQTQTNQYIDHNKLPPFYQETKLVGSTGDIIKNNRKHISSSAVSTSSIHKNPKQLKLILPTNIHQQNRPLSRKTRNQSDMTAQNRNKRYYSEQKSNENDRQDIKQITSILKRESDTIGKIKKNILKKTPYFVHHGKQYNSQLTNESQRITFSNKNKDVNNKIQHNSQHKKLCYTQETQAYGKYRNIKETAIIQSKQFSQKEIQQIDLEQSHYMMVLQLQKLKKMYAYK